MKDSAAKWQSLAQELPFVSVVLTHYNRPQLCSLALESIYAQDYPADRFEVVLVDDGSSDADAISWLSSVRKFSPPLFPSSLQTISTRPVVFQHQGYLLCLISD